MPRQTRSRAQTLRCPSPSQCLQVEPRWPPAEPRPRSRASVPGALLVGAQRRPAAGISWRRTRKAKPQAARPMEAVGQTRAGKVAALIAATSAAPKGRTSPSWPPAVPPACSTPRSASWRCPVRLHRIALGFLERGIDPGDRLLTPLLEPKISTPNCRTKVPPARHAKAQGNLSACAHRPPLAKSQRACRRNLARGKGGRAKLALVYHRINSNFVLKIVGAEDVADGYPPRR